MSIDVKAYMSGKTGTTHEECSICHGYGSSLKEGGGICSQCGGSGLILKKKEKQEAEEKAKKRLAKFEDYLNALEKKGYMISRDTNDVDRIYPPGESVTITGWYREIGVRLNPPGLNWHFFSGEEIEKFAEEIRKAGYDAFIHGWHQGKFISGSYTECWIYDVEIVGGEHESC